MKLETLVKLKSGLHSTVATLLNFDNKRALSERTLKKGLTETFRMAKINAGKRLSKIVKYRGHKALSLSIEIGMDESALNKYLNGEGNPTYFTLFKFADVLKIEVIDIFDYDGPLPDYK